MVGLAGCAGLGSDSDSGSTDTPSGGTPGSTGEPTSGTGPNYSQYRGVEITFAISGFLESIVNPMTETFAEETGIEVSTTTIPHNDFLARTTNSLRAQQADFDLYSSDCIWTGAYMAPEFAEPLAPRMNDSSLAMPEYNYDGHLDMIQDFHGKWGGERYGFPWWGAFWSHLIRKDVLEEHADEYEEKHGESILPDPILGYESYEKFDRVAQFMYEEHDWQISLEGTKGWNLQYWYDSRFSGVTGEPRMVSREDGEYSSNLGLSGAETALESFVDQVEWARNPLSTGISASQTQFLDGETWSVEHGGTAAIQAIDEFGYEDGLRIGNTPGRISNLGGFSWLINPFSNEEKKDAAFLFAQWATTEERQRKTFLESGIGPTRPAVITDDVKSELPFANYIDPDENPHIRTRALRPKTPNFAELNDVFENNVSSALSGQQSASAAISTVHDEWQDLLADLNSG